MTLTNPESGVEQRGSLASRSGLGGDRRAESLDDILRKLTTADQRLLRELAYKLSLVRGLEGRAVPSEEEALALAEYVEPWAMSMLVQGRSPRTVQLYRMYVGMLLRDHPRPTHDDIDMFLAGRVGAVSAGTLSNSIYALKSFFSYLALKGIIAFSPTEHVKGPQVPQRERVIPSANRVARLLGAPGITNKDRTIIMVFAACGLRVAELLGARRNDVDLARLQITVVGKGNKQRSVPMTEQTAAALERHIRSLPPSTPWLFPGKDPARPFNQFALNERFAIISERAEIPRITPHQLRHYFASTLLNAGVSLKIVSQLLGHKNPSVTANIYWHLLDESERVRAYEAHDPLQEINEEMARMVTGQLSFDFEEMSK